MYDLNHSMTTIILLLSAGVVLLVIDIIFVPGMILGILGALFMIAGIITAYLSEGETAGHISLGVSIVSIILMLIYAFKTDVWSKFALNSTIGSKVNDESKVLVSPGDEGMAISALRPSGKAEINGEIFEVFTQGNYCSAGQKIKVIGISNGKVSVEPVV